VKPIELIAALEAFLSSDMVPSGIRGVIITNQISDNRVKLGAAVVKIIVDKGFIAADGSNKYANVILCGTKKDRADEGDQLVFMEGEPGNRSVRELFFANADPPGQGTAVMVHSKDYTPLLQAIANLPAAAIEFRPPDARVLAGALEQTLGMKPEGVEVQLVALRGIVEDQRAQVQGLLNKIFEANKTQREDMQRRDEQMLAIQERMRQDAEEHREHTRKQQDNLEHLRKEEQAKRRQELNVMKEQFEAARKMQEDQVAMLKEEAEQGRRAHTDQMRVMQEGLKAANQEARRASDMAMMAASRPSGGGGCSIL